MSFTGSGRFSGGRRRGRHFLGRAGVSRSPPPAGPRTSRKGHCLEIAEGGGSRRAGGDTRGGGAAEAGDSGLAGGGCGDQCSKRAKGSPLQGRSPWRRVAPGNWPGGRFVCCTCRHILQASISSSACGAKSRPISVSPRRGPSPPCCRVGQAIAQVTPAACRA